MIGDKILINGEEWEECFGVDLNTNYLIVFHEGNPLRYYKKVIKQEPKFPREFMGKDVKVTINSAGQLKLTSRFFSTSEHEELWLCHEEDRKAVEEALKYRQENLGK